MRINYIVELNGKVVKSGKTILDNRKFNEFEREMVLKYRRKTDDCVQVLFR